MEMTTCPHCGKPLRPGSRFCGNCGNAIDIPAARSDRPMAAAEISDAALDLGSSDASSSGGSPCPHCGKPVRPGAKFCNNCGNPIPAEVPASPSRVPVVISQKATAPAPSISGKKSTARQGSAKSSPSRRPRSRAAIPLLIAGLLMACAAVITGGYVYLRDPFNWFVSGPLARVTSTTPINPTTSMTEKPTLAVSVAAPTSTLAPTSTTAPTDLPIPIPSDTPGATATVAQSEVLLVEDFDGKLSDQWVVWLAPNSPYRPKIDTGPGENYLYLLADQKPGDGGITSRIPMNNVPGLEIEFIGQLKEDLPGHVLIFDWDPMDVKRGPLSIQPGEIHLEIWRDRLVFDAPATGLEACQSVIVGSQQHIYRIEVLENQGLALFVDDSTVPVCQYDSMGLEPVPGKITFTGFGWITKVQVTTPAK